MRKCTKKILLKSLGAGIWLKTGGRKDAMQENQTTFRPSRDRRRILLIEDEYVNQEILKLFLEDSYNLVVVEKGTEALGIIHA